jgi:hypothetical protein
MNQQREKYLLSILQRSVNGLMHAKGGDIAHLQNLVNRGQAKFISYVTDGYNCTITVGKV